MGYHQEAQYAALRKAQETQKPARLWPWVMAGLVFAVALWVYLTPTPHVITNAERIWYCQSDLHC